MLLMSLYKCKKAYIYNNLAMFNINAKQQKSRKEDYILCALNPLLYKVSTEKDL